MGKVMGGLTVLNAEKRAKQATNKKQPSARPVTAAKMVVGA